MKKTLLSICLISPLLNFSQNGTFASGGEATTSQGSVSYTIGQIAVDAHGNPEGSVSPGIQQSYEIEELVVNSTNNLTKVNVNIFPNPVTSGVQLESEDFTSAHSIVLSDASGNILYKIDQAQTANIINMEEFPQGMYFINLFEDNKKTNAYKIIKN